MVVPLGMGIEGWGTKEEVSRYERTLKRSTLRRGGCAAGGRQAARPARPRRRGAAVAALVSGLGVDERVALTRDHAMRRALRRQRPVAVQQSAGQPDRALPRADVVAAEAQHLSLIHI